MLLDGFYRHLGWVDSGYHEDGQIRFTKSLRDAEQGVIQRMLLRRAAELIVGAIELSIDGVKKKFGRGFLRLLAPTTRKANTA